MSEMFTESLFHLLLSFGIGELVGVAHLLLGLGAHAKRLSCFPLLDKLTHLAIYDHAAMILSTSS